jgi:outer membrane immunogenic protein
MPNLFRATLIASSLLVMPVAASAADLGVPASAPPPGPVYAPRVVFTWTGFYAGGNVGGFWSQRSAIDSFNNASFGTGTDFHFMGGGQVGANYQFSNFVIGVEGDFDWTTNSRQSGAAVPIGSAVFQLSSVDRWIATAAGRFGYAAENWLFYVKGGGGWVGNSGFTVANITNGIPGVSVAGSGSGTQSGWLFGGGIEWAFWNNWSAKLEYDYIGLGNTSFTVPAGPVLAGDTFTLHNQNVQMVKIGINYLFNGALPY